MLTRYTEITAGGRKYVIDRQAKAILKEREELQHMTAQQIQLLEFFVSHAQNALVTQDQLRVHLYGNSAVNPEAVAVAVKSLRKILGKGFIQTVHAQGYRFIAEIAHVDQDRSEPTSTDSLHPPVNSVNQKDIRPRLPEIVQNSPLVDQCIMLITYLYVNDSKCYEYFSGYEMLCLRSTKTGQYFGYEYTPYAIEVTKDEFNPKRNPPDARHKRLKWLSVARLLLEQDLLSSELRDSNPRARDDRKIYSLTDQGRIFAAETVEYLKMHEPESVPSQSPFS